MFSHRTPQYFLIVVLLVVLLLPAGCDGCGSRIFVLENPSDELRKEKQDLEGRLGVGQVGAHHAFARQLGRVSWPLASGGRRILSSDGFYSLLNKSTLSNFNEYLKRKLHAEGIKKEENRQADGALTAFFYTPLFEPLFNNPSTGDQKYLALAQLILACTEALRQLAESLDNSKDYCSDRVDEILADYEKKLGNMPTLTVRQAENSNELYIINEDFANTNNYKKDPQVQEAFAAYRAAVKKVQADYEKVMGIDSTTPQEAQ
ncbi:MAG: hypothetical protein ROO73_05780 [Roseivirga sp.]